MRPFFMVCCPDFGRAVAMSWRTFLVLLALAVGFTVLYVIAVNPDRFPLFEWWNELWKWR